MSAVTTPTMLTSAYSIMTKEENKQSVAAIGRTIIGISSVYIAPFSAALGATAAGVSPEWTKTTLNAADFFLNNIWNNIDHNKKIAAASIGIGLCVTGGMVLSLPAIGSVLSIAPTVFALKVGAEMTLRNLNR